MKLLLTSNGITNKSITDALLQLVGKPFAELNLAFIPTAANVEEGNKDWFIEDLVICKSLGFASIDIVDISAVPRDVWEPRLNNADILLFEGGNTFHLMYWIKKSGLKDLLPELLANKVYVGISAGSMVTAPKLTASTSEQYYSEEIGKHKDEEALGYVNFHIRPHLNSPYFPKITKEFLREMAENVKEPIYAIDDQTAIMVVDNKTDIITEGEYLKLNQ
ncbi:MAG: Type 1 glutamine amidotransferase-like domain-containing protein [bacterium]